MIDIFDELSRNMWNLARRSLEPLTSISETKEKVVIEFDLPLVRKEDVQLRLVEEGLEMEATLKRCVIFERWGTVQRSCEFKSLYKVVPLSTPVVAENAKATFKKGILRVELHKKKEEEHRILIE